MIGAMIEDPNFTLDLAPCWVAQPGTDPEMYTFIDAARGITVILSSMSHHIDADRVTAFAELLVEMRLETEREAAIVYARPMVIYEPIIVPQSWGDAIAYYGHEVDGREFSYSGSVTPRAVINLYMESELLDEYALAQAMDEVLQRIEFDQPPLGRELRLH